MLYYIIIYIYNIIKSFKHIKKPPQPMLFFPSCLNELHFIPNLIKSETMTMIELQLNILDV